MVSVTAQRNIETRLDESFSHHEAFERNIGLVSGSELARLRNAHVAIAGLGGVGCAHLEVLVRQGIGGFTIADPDHFELANFNRQWGAVLATIGRSKSEVAGERIRSINPEARIRVLPGGVSVENMDSFLAGAEVVIDGLDYFSIDTRRALYRRAYERGIPVVTSGPMGFGATLHVFRPGGMTFDSYFGLSDRQTYTEKLLHFTVGLTPRGLHLPYTDLSSIRAHEKRGPSSAAAVALCASLVGTETVRLLLGWPGVRPAPRYLQVDLRRGMWREGRLRWGNRGPLQRLKLFLARKRFSDAIRDLEQPAKNELTAEEHQPIIRIVKAALLAPSGDNCQPWRFLWDGTILQIRLDRTRARHALDRRDHVSYITLGGVLETIRIAAGREGLMPEVTITSESGTGPAADVRLVPGPTTFDELLPGLLLRHTDRRPYRGGSLSAPFFSAARSDAGRSESSVLAFIDQINPTVLNYLGAAETLVWSHRRAQADLMRWMRFRRRDVLETRDGLPETALGIARWQTWILALCRVWAVQRLLNPIFLTTVRRRTVELVRSSGALGVIAVRSRSPEALVDAGRLFFRTWCRLNMAGYGVHPMVSGAISIYDQETGALDGVNGKFQRLIQRGGGIIREEFGLTMEEIPLLLFRTGRAHPSPAANRTLRRAVADALTILEKAP